MRFETKTPSEFVRVYIPQEGGKGQASTWMMRVSEIKGLSAQQIASKFALPHVPTHITDVKVPAGIQMRTTVANDSRIKEASVAGNGGGSGVQFEVLGEVQRSWFTNSRRLK